MAKIAYVCTNCGLQVAKWTGQCSGCKSWNTLQEFTERKNSSRVNYSGSENNKAVAISEVDALSIVRQYSGQSEFDRVLGGGLVSGSVVLLGGDPGIGKSTLLLQVFTDFAKQNDALYVTGEESLQQVALRARTIGQISDSGKVMSATEIETILSVADKMRPKLMIIDSIQTLHCEEVSGAAGSVSQVRQSTAKLVAFAKQTNAVVVIVGHMTKDGQIAGPRVLEHMVDTVLYFEGDSSHRFRIIRTVKNRFGPAFEIGVFAMTETGIKSVSNPSSLFMGGRKLAPGSVVTALWNGSRPILVEIQALVTPSYTDISRRVAIGFDQQRLGMLIAILQKHTNIKLGSSDVFVNVVGGLKVTETAADLAVIQAIVSSFTNATSEQNVIFGEVGLTGEVRPVFNGALRMKEAIKQGFDVIVGPKANLSQKEVQAQDEVNLIQIDSVSQLFKSRAKEHV